MALPQQSNNPFAIIQRTPSAWQGLEGSTSSGFLIFALPVWGVRAGFINLVNTYLNRGLNTISKILPVYAPLGHGGNDPEAYIAKVVRITGIGRNQAITTQEQLKKLGRAIITVEEGNFWVRESDFQEGFRLAMQARPWPSGTVVQASMGGGIILLLLAGGYYLYKRYRA
ncbi:MAG: hypothetical protein ACKV1O_31050 [Saprospiraceae bacterium]